MQENPLNPEGGKTVQAQEIKASEGCHHATALQPGRLGKTLSQNNNNTNNSNKKTNINIVCEKINTKLYETLEGKSSARKQEHFYKTGRED